MKIVWTPLLCAVAAAAQDKPLDIDVEALKAQAAAAAQEKWADIDVEALKAQAAAAVTIARDGALSIDREAIKAQAAAMRDQVGQIMAQVRPVHVDIDMRGYDRGSGSYERGTSNLDAHRYDEAIRNFDSVIGSKSARADGALYWRAYAQNRIGKRDDALASLAALRRDYPNSRWLTEAQTLEGELKQGGGGASTAASDANEDLKLMAINSLMNADPERAIPLLENLLKGNAPPRVKERALFVLTQNRSPRAQQILADYAKGNGNPDLQLNAIRYIGMSATSAAQEQLGGIYASASDAAVKRAVIRSLSMSHAADQIFTIARNEKDNDLRNEAVRQLGVMHAADKLMQLDPGATAESRLEVVRALRTAGAQDRLAELAKSEKDPKVRTEIIHQLASSRQSSPETLVSLYSSESDASVKRAIVSGLREREDAKTLIELARKESDPALKRQIVMQLGSMHNNKDVTEYMMEILK